MCHMLKLIRNLLDDRKVINHEENGTLMPIKWQYIDALNNIQEDLGFHTCEQVEEYSHCLDEAQNEC